MNFSSIGIQNTNVDKLHSQTSAALFHQMKSTSLVQADVQEEESLTREEGGEGGGGGGGGEGGGVILE